MCFTQKRIRLLIKLVVLLILTSATSGLAHAQADGCPEEGNDRARAQVISMLDDRQDILQRDGIDASPSELRLMTNDQDPDACAELIHPYLSMEEGKDSYRYRDFFYTTGDYYFMVKLLRPLNERPGDDPFGPASGSISVYDADHDIVAIYF